MSRYDQQWTTAVGVFADSCGITQWQHNMVNRAVDPSGHEHISIDRRVESAIETAAAYSSVQPDSIPLRFGHRNEIGKVVMLDRRQNRMQAVAVLPSPVELFEGVELYFSSGTTGDDKVGDYRLVLRELSHTSGRTSRRRTTTSDRSHGCCVHQSPIQLGRDDKCCYGVAQMA